MSILNRMLEAVESLLTWSMEEPAPPDEVLAARIEEFETTIREGREQVAAFAAAVHCQQDALAQFEKEASRALTPSVALTHRMAEKRREVAELRETYDQLQQTLKDLEAQLDAARQRLETLRMERFLKGGGSRD